MRMDTIFKLCLKACLGFTLFLLISTECKAIPLTDTQIEAIQQGCVVRAYEMGLERLDIMIHCSCMSLNIELLFDKYEKPTLDQLWEEVYMKCNELLKEKA